MNTSSKFLNIVTESLSRVEAVNQGKFADVAELMNHCLNNKGDIFFFGSGHSYYLGQEVFARAGGYSGFTPILENELGMNHPFKSTHIERTVDYADVIESLYDFKKGDLIFITSNSGRNPLTIELALRLKDIGLTIIAITSMPHSAEIKSRHSSGLKLYEIADVVLDNCAPYGDAVIHHNELVKTGPVSTITGCFIINAVVSTLTQLRIDARLDTPVFRSSNMDGADEYNKDLFKLYRK